MVRSKEENGETRKKDKGKDEEYGEKRRKRKSSGNHLVGNEAVAGEMGVLLVVIEPCLDYPLVAQGREPARLIEQLVDKLIRAVWL